MQPIRNSPLRLKCLVLDTDLTHSMTSGSVRGAHAAQSLLGADFTRGTITGTGAKATLSRILQSRVHPVPGWWREDGKRLKELSNSLQHCSAHCGQETPLFFCDTAVQYLFTVGRRGGGVWREEFGEEGNERKCQVTSKKDG